MSVPTRTRLLATALRDLAGTPTAGALLFTRALDRDEIEQLVEHYPRLETGWDLLGVGDSTRPGWITADTAVELREAKGAPAILLVDVHTAGAGMDGIYSAAREITEPELLNAAVKLAEHELTPHLRQFAARAVSEAGRVGGRRQKVPVRQVLAFFSALVDAPEDAGRTVHWLGLWPVAGTPAEAMDRLHHSRMLVERLLLPPATARVPTLRVAGLALENPAPEVLSELEELLRLAGGTTARAGILHRATANPQLWLGNLRPGFLTNKLQEIELVSWRSRSGAIAKWSGLTQDQDEQLPRFIIDKQNPKCRLKVCWLVRPEGLPKGSVTFLVRVLAGEQELASQTVELSDRAQQHAIITPEDFGDLDESVTMEACVEVSAPGVEGVSPQRTEDFVLVFGETAQAERVTAGELVRCAIEAGIACENLAELDEMAEGRTRGEQGQKDKHGFLSFRLPGTRKGFRVWRSPLLARIEDDWFKRKESPIGRWIVRCRPDGSYPGEPTFEPLPKERTGIPEWERLVEATQRLQTDMARANGILSRFYLHDHSSADVITNYLNAWQAVLEQCTPALALANTLEVQTLSGRTVGLIVLPFHPLRLAWQCAFDVLAVYMRFEEGLKPKVVREALAWLDGTHFPFALPGLRPGECFVFGDTLGLAGAAMVLDSDPEPKSSIAILAACYTGDTEHVAPGISVGTGDAIAREIKHYLVTHPECHILRVHALRPGDGATVARAIGRALQVEPQQEQESESTSEHELRSVAVTLDLYPSKPGSMVTGRHLVRLNQRRRAGTAAPPP